MNKKGFEFSFGWMFSIIIGAAFIFAAIYASTVLLDIWKTNNAASAAKEFGILLNPVETGIEEGTSTPIYFKVNTRVYFDCNNIGYFGNQQISTSIESSIGEKWEKPKINVNFNNKYIFGNNVVEGKKMTVFVKPLEMPYKIADVVYVLGESDSYCFVDAPNIVIDDMLGLGIKNVNISSNGKCPNNSTKVCFSGTNCDIVVDMNSKAVKKYRRTVYYVDDENNALIYGAIFSDPAIYECQIRRLMKKSSALAEIYLAKTYSLSAKGCNSNLENPLTELIGISSNMNNTLDLREVKLKSDDISGGNNALNCRLF